MYVSADGFGIAYITGALVGQFSRIQLRMKIPLALTPECILKLAFGITRKVFDITLDGILLVFFVVNMILLVVCNCSILNPGPNSLSIVYNNVRGFINTRDLTSDSPPLNMTKVHEVQGFIFTHKPDVIILNETWLKKSINSNEVLPDNYKVFRLDRSTKSHPFDPTQPRKFRKNGGGVLIAHRCDISISSVKFTKVTVQAELLSINLKTDIGKNFCISTFYRVGTLGSENFEQFKTHFVALAAAKKLQNHVLVGDFNMAGVSWPEGLTTCRLHANFINFLTGDLGHSQLISSSTHMSSHVLDLVFTNIPGLIKNVKVLDHNEMCLSDHFAITFNIDIKTKYIKQPKRKVFSYDKGNYDSMNRDLFGVDWDRVFNCNDPYVCWDRFKHILGRSCERWVPKRTVKSQFQPPWYDSDCDRIRRKREKWRKRAETSNSESDLAKFRSLRKQFKKIMDEKMRINVQDDSDHSLISKKFWTHVKSKSKSTRIPETVQYGDRFRNNPSDQANLFNEYFYEQFSEESDYSIDIDYENDLFSDFEIHSHDILLILKKTNSRKAAGPDGIHGKILKKCARSLAYPLSLLFNLSFSTGCIPPDWKLASVVPVHKKDDKSLVENYRPISLTSLIMKVFERSIKTALYDKCVGLLDTRQHGFMNDRSCTTQMVPFTNDLALALNNKSRIDVIYFDFAKAFDSVSHDLILNKLKFNYNIDGLMLKFVKSYLEGRKQQVVIGGYKSSILTVKSGVPQGSILGPLLFVLFINDMFSCISEGTNIALYADDTKIWREILSFSDHHVIQNDINRLYDWSLRNKMVFHPKKCKALAITLQRNVLDNLPFNNFVYTLNESDSDSDIDSVQSQADLGVQINTRFTWGAHCDSLVSKASSRLGLLRRTCHFTTDRRQKRSFYLALVRSIFEHCSVVWSPQSSTHMERFAAIQKRAIKWINGEQFTSYSDELFASKQKELNILPMKLKFIYNDLVLFYKIVNNIIPLELPDYITVCVPEGSRYTRRNAQIHELTDTSTYESSIVPCIDAFRHSFYYRTMLRWNDLPIGIRQAECLTKFKTALQIHLWTADDDWPD
jgi:endonuclease/exonuclease/phosphatase family metal-dependent hydrolase